MSPQDVTTAPAEESVAPPPPFRGVVREARRPPGWVPPGPTAAGPGDRPDLWPGEGEDLCFLTGEWRIFQRLKGHRYSLDDLLTAWYGVESVAGRRVTRALDLGCGIGSVLLMVAWSRPEAALVGIEAQELSVGLARRSIAYDGAEDRCEVRHGDLRDPALLPEGAVFDLVTGSPPYIPLGEGVVSEVAQRGPCRFEFRGGVEGYCEAAARALAPEGRFAVCHSDLDRVLAAARDAGLAVLRRRDVLAREGRPVRFVLFEMARAESVDPATPTCVEPPLMVRDAAGNRTPDYVHVREAMGMPP